jgi:hypothetical protein
MLVKEIADQFNTSDTTLCKYTPHPQERGQFKT